MMNSSTSTPSTLFGNAFGNALGNAFASSHDNASDKNYYNQYAPQATNYYDNQQQPSVLTQSPMLDPTYPSICIPRTHHSVTWKLVKDAFEEIFGGGCIEQVDVVKRTHPNGQKSCKVFIHFNAWPNTSYAQSIRQQIIDGNTMKIVYQFPWYWKCMMSHSPKRRWNGPAPYIHKIEPVKTTATDNIGTSNDADATRDYYGGGAMEDVSSKILECMEDGHQLPDGRIVGGESYTAPVPENF